MKLDPIEKLAREICWREFSTPTKKNVGCTKAEYWERVSESKKAEYLRDARFLKTVIPRLPRVIVEELVWPMAEMRQAEEQAKNERARALLDAIAPIGQLARDPIVPLD